MYIKFNQNGKVETGYSSLPTGLEDKDQYIWVDDSLGTQVKKLKNGKVKQLSEKEIEEKKEQIKLELFSKQVISRAKGLLLETNYLIENDVWFTLEDSEKIKISTLRQKLKNIEKEEGFPFIDFSLYKYNKKE